MRRVWKYTATSGERWTKKEAVKMKNIKFLVNVVAGGWSPRDTRLGGTEESVVEWSKQLANRGHHVEVYYNGLPDIYDGVFYIPREMYIGGDGVTVNVKSSDIPPQEPTWYLTNETDAKDKDLSAYTGIILPSKWAYDNLHIEHPNMRILSHGYDPAKIYYDKEQKIENMCLYASSPDRGLVNLIDLWPQVVEQVPSAQLIVTYGGQIDTPNTICMGDIDDDTMSQLFREADIWVHPCNGGELFCISGIKAQVSGAIPVFYPVMALAETVRHGFRCDNSSFVFHLVNLMNSNKKKSDMRYKLREEHYMTWEETAIILERMLYER